MVKRLALVLVAVFLFCGVGEAGDFTYIDMSEIFPNGVNESWGSHGGVKTNPAITDQQVMDSIKDFQLREDYDPLGEVFNKIFQKGKWVIGNTDGPVIKDVIFEGYFKNTQGSMRKISIRFRLNIPTSAPIFRSAHKFEGGGWETGLPEWLEYELIP